MADKEEVEIDETLDENYDPEMEVYGNWKKVDLPEVAVVTGEEDDEILAKFRTKLYRFRNGEWKERGVGEFKFLKNKTSNKIRVLMRGEKTLKIVINHLIQKKEPYCLLEPLKTSNNAWTWNAYDISDEKPQAEKFCAKFTSKEEYERFETEFNKACDTNAPLFAGKGDQKAPQTKQQKKEQKPAVKEEPKTEQVPKSAPTTSEEKKE